MFRHLCMILVTAVGLLLGYAGVSAAEPASKLTIDAQRMLSQREEKGVRTTLFTGGVTIRHEGIVLTADNATATTHENISVIFAGGTPRLTDGPTVITAANIELHPSRHEARCNGTAKMEGQLGSKTTGSVLVPFTATADTLVYDYTMHAARLIGNVTVKTKDATITSTGEIGLCWTDGTLRLVAPAPQVAPKS